MKSVNIDNKHFAFINVNREVDCRELKKSIHKVGRVLSPIMVALSDDIEELTLDCTFTNPKTDETYDTLPKGTLVVFDGQHRLKSLFELNKEEEEKENKSLKEKNKWEKEEKAHPSDKPMPSVYEAHLIDEIPIIQLTKDEIGDNISDFIVEINSTSRNWKSKDYIDNASLLNQGNELIDTIKFFSDRKFAISTISRYICFSNSALKAENLNQYALLPPRSANPKRAKEIYDTLHSVGFSDSFLRKRYIIEFIIGEHNSDRYKECLDKLSHLIHDDVFTIEKFSSDDFTNDKLQTLLENRGDELQRPRFSSSAELVA